MNHAAQSLVVLAPLWLESRALRGSLYSEVIRFGVGPNRALRAAERFMRRMPGPFAVAVAGVCGALTRGLVPGDVVVATEIRGNGAPRLLESAKPLARALESLGARVHLGPIHSVDHVVKSGERESLAATGAIAVDMESAWLAPLADQLPFAVMRVVSDGPDHELMSLRIVANGIRALRSLRAAAPALETWAHSPEANS